MEEGCNIEHQHKAKINDHQGDCEEEKPSKVREVMEIGSIFKAISLLKNGAARIKSNKKVLSIISQSMSNINFKLY